MHQLLTFILFILSISSISYPLTAKENSEKSASLVLKEQLSRAQVGDYWVLLQNKNYTFLHVVGHEKGVLSIVEISLPQAALEAKIGAKNNGKRHDWAKWLEQGAPLHSNWVIYDIDLQSASFLQLYSLTYKRFIKMEAYESFLTSLIQLQFKEIAPHERRKIGQPPKADSPDYRRIWQPPLFVRGEKREALFSAWQGTWPQDHSPLAGKRVEIFLPPKGEDYPDYFPSWIFVAQSLGKGSIRVVDSGRGLANGSPSIP